MNTPLPVAMGKTHTKPACSNKQLFDLVDYLFSLRENNFTGQLEIDFKGGMVNKVAFNQQSIRLMGTTKINQSTKR